MLNLLKGKKRLIFGILCVLVLPMMVPAYFQQSLNQTLIYVIVAVGLNILLGYTGQISLGHAAFMGIGAFTSALLVMHLGWSYWLAIPMGGVLACLLGLILGLPALRLSGYYLAIATLGFGVAITQIMSTLEITGRYSGIMPDPLTFMGRDLWYGDILKFGKLELTTDFITFYIALVFVIATFYIATNILKSRTGRAFTAIRDSEVAALAMGVNIVKYKLIAFGLSAFFAGIAGGLYAHIMQFISPTVFNLGMSLNFFAIVIIGGLGTLRGAIYGALFMTIVPEFFSRVQNLPSVLMGLSIILVTLFLRGGIATLEMKLVTALGKLKSRFIATPTEQVTPTKQAKGE